MFPRLALSLLAIVVCGSALPFDLTEYRIVDLSHGYGNDTLYWPTSPTSFEKHELAYGDTEQGYCVRRNMVVRIWTRRCIFQRVACQPSRYR